MAVESADDLAVFFNTDDFAVSGSYRVADAGDPVTVTVLADLGTRSGDVLDGRFVESGGTFMLRKSEVDAPAIGDSITIDGQKYIIQSQPELEFSEKVWRLEARPA